VVKIFLN